MLLCSAVTSKVLTNKAEILQGDTSRNVNLRC